VGGLKGCHCGGENNKRKIKRGKLKGDFRKEVPPGVLRGE